MKRFPAEVQERFAQCYVGDVGISAITLAELRYGVECSGDERAKNAKSAQTHTPAEWKQALVGRKKIYGSGYSIMEEVEDPSKKTGIKKVGK